MAVPHTSEDSRAKPHHRQLQKPSALQQTASTASQPTASAKGGATCTDAPDPTSATPNTSHLCPTDNQQPTNAEPSRATYPPAKRPQHPSSRPSTSRPAAAITLGPHGPAHARRRASPRTARLLPSPSAPRDPTPPALWPVPALVCSPRGAVCPRSSVTPTPGRP